MYILQNAYYVGITSWRYFFVCVHNLEKVLLARNCYDKEGWLDLVMIKDEGFSPVGLP